MRKRFLLIPLILASACGGGEIVKPPAEAPPPPKCEIQGTGTYWLEETESFQTTFSCGTDEPFEGSDFVVTDMPSGAVYDPLTATLSFKPGLDQAAVYEFLVKAPRFYESSPLKLGVADKFDDPQNVPVVDPGRYTEEFGLPVLFLTTDPNVNATDYTPASVTYRGRKYLAPMAKYRGAASLGYPKKSFTVDFDKTDKFNEPKMAGGFEKKRKITLTTTFDDNSYVRQRLAFALWNRLSPAHIQIQQYSAVVFLNGNYQGLYAITDHVDGYLMEDHGYNQNGNLYKSVNHDGNFRLTAASGNPKATPHDGYEKKEGLPVDDFSDLDALVNFVATSTDDAFTSKIGTMINTKDFEDWWIFVSLIEADDSAGKNAYLYHDPVTNEPFRYAPWDFNDSFGQTWQSARKGFDRDPTGYAGANRIFERMLADPTMGPALRARFTQSLDQEYKVDAVLALLDEMLAEVHAGALRDERRWGQQYRTYGGWSFRTDFLTHDEEAAYLRQWIMDRWTFARAWGK